MILLPTLLFATVGTAAAPMPSIAIDACVDVDAEEVRRLAAIELSTSEVGEVAARLEVSVGCADETQELRVTDRTSGVVTTRSIDLNARFAKDRDAKARELALTIAEVVRRADLEAEAQSPSEPAPEPRRVRPPPAAAKPGPPARPEEHPFRGELGLMGTVTGWTAGELLLGVDAMGRARLGHWLLADVRLGGRKTQSIALQRGTLDASGVAAAIGLSVDVAPSSRLVGVAFGARLEADWLRYAAVDTLGATYGGGDAGAVSASAVATGFVVLAPSLCVTADGGVGTALHSVRLQDQAATVSAMHGVVLSASLGLSTHF